MADEAPGSRERDIQGLKYLDKLLPRDRKGDITDYWILFAVGRVREA